MAFEQLEPYRAEILQLRTPGPGQLSYAKLVEHLRSKYRLITTAGTLCRYVNQLAPELGLRETTRAEDQAIDTAVMFAELLAEIRGRGEEQRRAIENLAGQIRVLSETLTEAQNNSATSPSSPDPQLVRRIWLRAFLLCLATVVLSITAFSLLR